MHLVALGIATLCLTFPGDDPPGGLAGKAKAVLQMHCYRCHGQEGTNEGGFNYVLDLKQLVARNKVTRRPAEVEAAQTHPKRRRPDAARGRKSPPHEGRDRPARTLGPGRRPAEQTTPARDFCGWTT